MHFQEDTQSEILRCAQDDTRGEFFRSLLKHRAKGTTTHAILSDTILFILAKGPLRTTELHPMIQQLQPDICDDSIDRVIDGVHFGKRWKHYVRTAQQFLKRTERVYFDGDRWHLTQGV